MSTGNIEGVSTFSFLLLPFEICADVVNVLIADESAELFVVLPPQLGLLPHQFGYRSVLLLQFLPQLCHFSLQLQVSLDNPISVHFLGGHAAEGIELILLLFLLHGVVLLVGTQKSTDIVSIMGEFWLAAGSILPFLHLVEQVLA